MSRSTFSEASILSNKLPELIDQHKAILTDHLNLWTAIRNQQSTGSKDYLLAQECIENTQSLRDHFDRLSAIGDSTEKRPSHPMKNDAKDDIKQQDSRPATETNQKSTQNLSLRPSKRKHTDDVAQNSRNRSTKASNNKDDDLFTIDPNPTPITDLLSVPTRPVKRARGKLYAQYPSENVLGEITDELEDLIIPLSAKKPQLNQGAPPEPRPVDISTETARDEDSFLAKFNQKILDKEEKKKKKTDKKRKRDSQASVTSNDGPEQTNGEKRVTKKVKRVKGYKSTNEAEAKLFNNGQKRAGPEHDSQRKRTRRENAGNGVSS